MNESEEDKKFCGYILSNDNFLLVCEFCGSDHNSLEGFVEHINEHFPEQPENSIICGSEHQVVSQDILQEHSTTVGGATVFESIAAGSLQTEEPDILILEDGSSIEESLINLTDENETNSSDTYGTHICDLCHKSFTASGSLSCHMRLHTRKKCVACGNVFGNKSKLEVHIREKHLPDTDPRRYFSCDLCDEKFSTDYKMRHHKYRTHPEYSIMYTCEKTGTTYFKCMYCAKTFERKGDKTRHEQNCTKKNIVEIHSAISFHFHK